MAMATSGRRVALTLLMFLAILAIPDWLWSQDALNLDNKFLPAPRTLTQRLGRAREAIKQQKYNVAVEELGAILSPDNLAETEDGIDQDYFIAPSGLGGPMPSLKSEAQRLLGSMPKEGRELYELRYGAAARDLLEQAVKEGNANKLTEVTRRYLHTRGGYEAMMLLGRHHLDEGRPLAAAVCFQRLASSPQAVQTYDPELSILLATCWVYAGSNDKAKTTLDQLKRRMPDGVLRIADQQVRLSDNQAATLAWLENVLGQFGRLRAADKSQWVLYRGDAARNASSTAGMPVVNYRWRVPTTNDPADEQMVQEYARQLASSGTVLLPSVQPLAVNDVILMRTPRRLMAVDFQTGKRIWEFPWDDTPDELAEKSQEFQQARNAPSPRMQELGERLWQDAAYGQISSDGDLAFVLSDLSYASATVQNIIQRGGFPQNNAYSPKQHNKLVALSLAREGALQWVVGGEDGADEPGLAGAFFLGVPLPVMGQLFVLAEIAGELRLVALDPQTGALQWQQQLAHVDTLTIEQDMPRRLAGATPSFADGVLVCPTSAGAIVALDVSNRSLLWGYQYPTNLNNQAPGRFPFNRPIQPTPTDDSWADATITIADGRVLLTPVESDELHCLDLLTGEPLWEARKRGDALLLGCVYQNKAILIGQNSVQAIDLADGTPAWNAELDLGDMSPSGRGIFSGQHYYLPTSNARLLQIDLEKGQITSEADTRMPLGNLICYKDQILSQNVDWLTTFYQSEPLRKLVDERLAKDPKDRWALARHCELLLQDGKRQEALATMWTTYEADPQDDSLRALLVQTFLEALQEDFAAHADRIKDLEPLIDQPQQRAAYLRLIARGLQQTGDLDGAFNAVLRLADEQAISAAAVVRDDQPEAIDRRWSVRRDRWVQGRIASLLNSAAAPQHEALRQRWSEQIGQRLETALAANSRAELRKFIDQFSPHPFAQRARLAYVQLLMDDNELLAAELQMAGLIDSPDPAIAATATALMAKLLTQVQRYGEALPYVQRLERQYANQVVLDPLTGAQLVSQMRTAEPQIGAGQSPHAWPYGKVQVVRSADVQDSLLPTQRVYPVSPREMRGPWPQGAAMVVDSRTNSIVVHDAYGRPTQQIPMNPQRSPYNTFNSMAFAKANGHLAVISLQAELVAIDTLRQHQDPQDAVLWRADLNEATTSPSVRGTSAKMLRHPFSHSGVRSIASDGSQARIPLANVGPITRHGISYQRFREILCVDPLTGEIVWSREGIEPGADLFGDEQLLIVVPYDQEQALVLDAATGELLDTRPVEKLENRWAHWGRNVLSWTERANQLHLKLRDVWTGQTLWESNLASGTRGELVEDDEVALLQPDGQCVIVSLRDGAEQFRGQLEKIQDLAYLYVQRSSQRYIILAARPVGNLQRLSIVQPNAASPVMHGKLYSVWRATGRFEWPAPADIEQLSIPSVQPAESPVLVLLRNISYKAPQNRQFGSVLCIDKRDGRILLADDELPRQTNAYEITSDPSQNAVHVALSGQTFTFRFTDEPTAPAPPAQTGDAASVPNPFTANRVRQWAGAIVDTVELLDGSPTPPPIPPMEAVDEASAPAIQP